MTENGKAQIQALGAGLIGFVAVVGAGAMFMLPHRSAVKAPPATPYAAVDVAPLSAPAPVASPKPATAAASMPVNAPAAAPSAVGSSPAPILGEADRAEAPAAAAPASEAAAPAAAAPASDFSRKLVTSQHLDGTASAHSSAKATVASASAKKAVPAPAKKFVMPKLDLSKGTQGALASVHYGVSNRSELMGRAAGPVYNFQGTKPSGAQNQPAPSAAGALSQVDAASQQIDASSMSDADKAAIKGNLDQVRQAVQNGAPQK